MRRRRPRLGPRRAAAARPHRWRSECLGGLKLVDGRLELRGVVVWWGSSGPSLRVAAWPRKGMRPSRLEGRGEVSRRSVMLWR